MLKRVVMLCALTFCLAPSIALSSDIDASDAITSSAYLIWLGLCIALVLFMQCGFLFLESGMVRSKNAINVILKNFTDVGLGSVGYWMFGFGLMFGENASGWIGLSNFFPNDLDNTNTMNFLYQLMFAATAATIVSGAIAERFSFLPYIIAAMFITTVIYPIFGSWAWGGQGDQQGWLASLGFHDAAGATVVHSIGGWCALGALMFIGPRFGRYSRKGAVHDIAGHNLPYVAIGGFILWFGWFGFNGASVSQDLNNIGQILLNTQFGAVGGICGGVLWLAITKKGFYITRIINAALGGLVASAASCDVVAPQYMLIIGVVSGSIVVITSNMLDRMRIDDVVGAVAVHGFCGAWGTLAVAFFYDGDMFNIERIVAQSVGVVVAFIWGISTSYVLFWCLNKVMPLRVPTKFEQRGLDITEHKEIAYSEFITTHARADK